MKQVFTLLLLLFFIRGRAQTNYFPPTNNSTWDTLSPTQLNWCSSSIDSLNNYLQSTKTDAFIILKNGKLRCYFLDNPKSPYYESQFFPKVMAEIQSSKKKCNLKQSGNSLILVYDNIKTMHETEVIFKEIDEKVFGTQI